MSKNGMSYADALFQAQRLGYAEPDPTNDVDGIDAACKLAILTRLAMHAQLVPAQINARGIRGIDAQDIRVAGELGYAVKLLGVANRRAEGIEAYVYPALLPQGHPLSAVDDALNAVYLDGSAVGSVMLYGRGAGDRPTASAMLSDLINAAAGDAGILVEQAADLPLIDDRSTGFYLRVMADEAPGSLARISGVLAQQKISISVLKQSQSSDRIVPVHIITHSCSQSCIDAAVQALKALPCVQDVAALLRVEE